MVSFSFAAALSWWTRFVRAIRIRIKYDILAEICATGRHRYCLRALGYNIHIIGVHFADNFLMISSTVYFQFVTVYNLLLVCIRRRKKGLDIRDVRDTKKTVWLTVQISPEKFWLQKLASQYHPEIDLVGRFNWEYLNFSFAMPGAWLFTVSLKSWKIKFGSILFIYLQQLSANVRRKCLLSIKKNLPQNFLLLKRFWRYFCKLASLFFAERGGGGGWGRTGRTGRGLAMQTFHDSHYLY